MPSLGKKILVPVMLLSLSTAGAQVLPSGSTSQFTGSGNCAMCHVSDGAANTENGVDISNVTQWRSTMMANSAKDPLWRAKVSAEADELPQFREVIESTCTRCHAPLGNAQAFHDGATGYSVAQMEADPLALDGVSCTICHQVEPDNFGLPESYSGNFLMDDVRSIYGPYPGPLTQPMVNQSNFVPVFSEHLGESELCATCHTLFTSHVGEDGQLAGSFPEQTPYLEWKNSTFGQNGVECQSCHMPVAATAQDLSIMPPWHTTLREPFAKHEFAGANEFMLKILRDNGTALGVTASAANFDSTLARTREMLENQTVSLSAMHDLGPDTLAVDLLVENLCGHKLPTGIPLRRMWIHLKVTESSGQTVFESGNWDTDGEVAGLDQGYEPHHNLITSPDQVQIYEPVMGDFQGNVTHTLLRSSHYIKDNRIPPMGSNTSHSAYDSTAVFGLALQDPDFNRDGLVEGRGADTVHYRIPVNSTGTLTVTAEALYQTITPRFYADLVAHDTPEVQTFRPMYAAADKSPSLLGRLEFSVEGISAVEQGGLPQPVRLNQNVPNPFNPMTVISYEIQREGQVTLTVHDISGRLIRKLVDDRQQAGSHTATWDGTDDQGLAQASGVYLCRIQSADHIASRRMTLVR